MNHNIITKNYYFFIPVIILLGIILRIYNLNFEDFWSDEMVSYWLSDPKNSFFDSLEIIFNSNLTISYELLLKYFHLLFGYNIKISRYFNVILSVISIFFFYKLLIKNSDDETNNKALVCLGLFLISLNIFHIRYAIEVRAYTLTFLLSLIYIDLIFYKKLISKNLNFLKYFYIFIISILMLFSHAFSIIILISANFYLLINYVLKKNYSREGIFIFFINIFSATTFLYIYLNGINHTPYWISQVKKSFFTNFYFSNFFGSRLVGTIYLLTLIITLKIFYKEVVKKLDINSFFIILIFFTYLIPLVYGYLFNPVLIPRYIFFVLIPILFLITNFSLKIKNNILKRTIISLLVVFTFFNHFTENTFKQFYKKIYPSKPEIGKSLKYISNLNYQNFTFLMDPDNILNINSIYSNYLKSYAQLVDENMKLIDYQKDEVKYDYLWLMYITDVTNQKKFNKPKFFDNYGIVSNKNFNHVQLYLLKKNGS
jgi:hypothetical protein